MVTNREQPNDNTSPNNTQTAVEQPTTKNSKFFLTHLAYLKTCIQRQPWGDYLKSLALIGLVTLLGQPLSPFVDHANLVMLYLLAEVIAATRFGLGPSIVAAIASVTAFNFFFIMPHFTFAIEEAQHLLTFSGLLIVGLVISTLTARIRQQAKTAQRREAQASASYHFSRSLAEAVGLEAIVQATISHIKQVFDREVLILLPKEAELSLQTLTPDSMLDELEYTVANWVFQSGRPAGRGTQIYAAANLRYHPLKTARGVVGVLGIKPPSTSGRLSPEQQQLLEVFTSQTAVAVERNQLARQAQQNQLLLEKEKLQTALLNSISHDLRTPLASITGVLSSLYEDEAYLDAATRHELVESACEEAERMNRLVANLLDMSRLQAGSMKVEREPGDVQDLVGVALAELHHKLQGRPVTVNIPIGLPLIPFDFVLMSRVLINLLDNAHKYSPAGRPIEIRAHLAGTTVEIEVADRGPGIPPDEVEQVFEKFYRVQRADGVSGTGLGLSICKGIVEGHGGRIWAHNRPGGGAIITLALPLYQPETAQAEMTS